MTLSTSPETDTHASEHRAYPRIDLVIDITLTGEHNFFIGLTENISAGGVFVATHEAYSMGALVDLTLTLPERERPIRARGEVRWVRPYNEANDAPAGVGIKFAELSEDDEVAIKSFTEQRPPIFYA